GMNTLCGIPLLRVRFAQKLYAMPEMSTARATISVHQPNDSDKRAPATAAMHETIRALPGPISPRMIGFVGFVLASRSMSQKSFMLPIEACVRKIERNIEATETPWHTCAEMR